MYFLPAMDRLDVNSRRGLCSCRKRMVATVTITVTDELRAMLDKPLCGMSCDHRTKGGTMDLIVKDKSGEVYMCRGCGRLMRLGYIGGRR